MRSCCVPASKAAAGFLACVEGTEQPKSEQWSSGNNKGDPLSELVKTLCKSPASGRTWPGRMVGWLSSCTGFKTTQHYIAAWQFKAMPTTALTMTPSGQTIAREAASTTSTRQVCRRGSASLGQASMRSRIRVRHLESTTGQLGFFSRQIVKSKCGSDAA